MAAYKEAKYLTKAYDPPYDLDIATAMAAPFAGIYRCMGCGREIVSDHGDALPDQNHHSHTASEGAIRWRLIVFADQDPKWGERLQ
jgi:hypothetical protein